MSYWIKCDPLKRYKLPSAPACYVIYMDGRLVYIGQTSNIKTRLSNHDFRYDYGNAIITPWGQCQKLKMKVNYGRRYGDWAMRELRLIKRLKPSLNCAFSVRARRCTSEVIANA